MILKETTGLRLALGLAACLALLAMQNARAGLIFTAKALDYSFTGSEVDYQSHTLTIRSGDGSYRLPPSVKRSSRRSSETETTLYLTMGMVADSAGSTARSSRRSRSSWGSWGSRSSLGWEVTIFDDLRSARRVSTSELLRGSLEQITPVEGDRTFRFLVQDNTVDSRTTAVGLRQAGINVQLAGLNDPNWFEISKSLAALEGNDGPALSGVTSPNNPAIPVPGTPALLILGTVSIAASRRRR